MSGAVWFLWAIMRMIKFVPEAFLPALMAMQILTHSWACWWIMSLSNHSDWHFITFPHLIFSCTHLFFFLMITWSDEISVLPQELARVALIHTWTPWMWTQPKLLSAAPHNCPVVIHTMILFSSPSIKLHLRIHTVFQGYCFPSSVCKTTTYTYV